METNTDNQRLSDDTSVAAPAAADVASVDAPAIDVRG
jgi:hypothetical protein